jgi:sulfite exporter TauE/SafE/copper chaperone CopZ
MESAIKTENLLIAGMTCDSCQRRIEKKLRAENGIESAEVSYTTGIAKISYNSNIININAIISIIENLGYSIKNKNEKFSYREAGILIIIFSIFILLKQLGFTEIFNSFPLAQNGMKYSMLFVIGIITSVHCIAMCGGINLSQSISHSNTENKSNILYPSVMYNIGRVISYTLIGAIVGALGSIVNFSQTIKAVIQIAAGIFMVIMGINMLGIFPYLKKFNIKLPSVFTKKIDKKKQNSNSPLYIGLLNGFMPCGPLQAMQIYALSTGNAISGGISMFAFSIGTVPLMFALGTIAAILGKKFSRRIITIGAVIVTIMGLFMFSYGWNLGGFSIPSVSDMRQAIPASYKAESGGSSNSDNVTSEATVTNGIQIINSQLLSGRYPSITVQEGIPVKWIIEAQQKNINGCNYKMFIKEYKIEHKFIPGENVIEFIPARTGKFTYSCWMGMIHGRITVVKQNEKIEKENIDNIKDSDMFQNVLEEPVIAGFRIPVSNVAVGTIEKAVEKNIQTVEITLTDKGFKPAAIVIQKDVETLWTINNVSYKKDNTLFRFPAFKQEIPIEENRNEILLYPQDDFEFSTSDSEYYGYVKVVDNLKNFNMEKIKSEISGYQTMIYPDNYFYSGNMACCRNPQ